MPHLFADISSHGFGHLAQAAPVLTALRQRCPDLRLTIRSGLSRERLARRIAGPFEHLAEASDFGFVMKNALELDLPATASRYRDFHADWPARVAQEGERLRALCPDAVFSDVAYLPLAGAAAADIPSLALCSLNWADLFHHHFGAEPWAAPIHAAMLAAYRSSHNFLRTTPGMAMTALTNLDSVGPVATRIPADRASLASRLCLPAGRRWVLVALGGFDLPLPAANWPSREDILWLLPATWGVNRADVYSFDDATPFPELFACADAALAKPGYGTFVEAAVQQVPLLYLRRPDWPEEACLTEWMHRHGRARELSREEAESGALLPALDGLWALPTPRPPTADGAHEAAERLLRLMGC